MLRAEEPVGHGLCAFVVLNTWICNHPVIDILREIDRLKSKGRKENGEMKKHRLITVLLALLLVTLSAACIYAADEKATKAADVLYELGLFAGTGTNEDGTPMVLYHGTPAGGFTGR